jgi:hypothetical protein
LHGVSASKAKKRAEHLKNRQEIDGRLTAVDRPHGLPGTYTNYGCRCEQCTTAHSAYLKEQRIRRHEQREVVDGRLVAVHARKHGTPSTYFNHGCRCEECCAARRR